MRCPKCGCENIRVLDTRDAPDTFSTKRRRLCSECGFRFSTIESVIREEVSVIKRNRKTEEFDAGKIRWCLSVALKRSNFREDYIDSLLASIVNELLRTQAKSIRSDEISEVVIQHLKRTDARAYQRYLASREAFRKLEN